MKITWVKDLTKDQILEIASREKVWQKGTKHGKGVWWHATPACFDIETTQLEKISVMWLWQFQLDELTIMGRTWEEWLNFINDLKESFKDVRLAIFVHNLGFEFGFIRSLINCDFIQWRSLENPIWVDSDNLQFRCSHKLTNLSLEMFLKKEKVDHQKTTMDYHQQRFPWSPINESDLIYGAHDVVGLQEALISLMKREGETVATLPKTQTGFVRREVRKIMKPKQGWLKGEKFGGVSKLGDFRTISMLKQCFEGGSCAVSRWAVGEAVDDVWAFDFKSSYPARMLFNRFPMNPFIPVPKDQLTHAWLKEFSRRDYAWVATVRFDGLRLKDEFNPIPCLRSAHGHGRFVNPDVDLFNGRILKADWFITTINEIDFLSIEEDFTWDSITVLDAMVCTKKDFLPMELRDFINNLFLKKENAEGADRVRAKEMLNSIFGMSVTDPLKPVIEWNGKAFVSREATEEDFNKNRKSMFMSFAWGVWTASYARRALTKIIHMVPWKRVLYCDTDSVFVRGKFDFSSVNQAMEKKSKELGFSFKKTPGTLELQHEGVRFKSLGTKCYLFSDQSSVREDERGRWSDSLIDWAEERDLPTDTTIHTVVSGLNAMKGSLEISKFDDPFKAFEPGLKFDHVFQTTTIHKHHVWEELGSQEIEIDGNKLWVPNDCVIIKDSPFILQDDEIDDDPFMLIEFCEWEKRKLDHLKEVMK